MDVESSDLDGLAFSCLAGCSLCCRCQPELGPHEARAYRADPALRAGLAERSVSGEDAGNGAFLRVSASDGACHFLARGRCSVYSKRPARCRLFPVHIHTLDRVQAVGNLSCRGLALDGPGAPARSLVGPAMADAAGLGLDALLRDSRRRYAEFLENAVDGREELARPAAQALARAVLDGVGFERFVSGALTFASWPDWELEDGPVEPSGLLEFIRELEPTDVSGTAVEGARDALSGKTPAELPSWVDHRGRLVACCLDGGSAVMYELAEGSAPKTAGKVKLSRVGLRRPSEGALAVMEGYARRIIARDHSYGAAAYVMSVANAGSDEAAGFLKAYMGWLGTAMLDYWFRTSIVAAFMGKGDLDARTAWEGIRAFDMDILDAPSIGGFV